MNTQTDSRQQYGQYHFINIFGQHISPTEAPFCAYKCYTFAILVMTVIV